MNASRTAGARSYVAGTTRTNDTRADANTLVAHSSTAATASTFCFMGVPLILIPARRPLLRRQHFQAGRPPTALDRRHELLGQPLRAHLRGPRRVVGLARDELDGCVRADGQHRVPDVRTRSEEHTSELQSHYV